MPTNKSKTPNFGTPFKSAVKRGTPASTAVANIARLNNTTENVIWNWLFKNGFVDRKKFGANFIYWPSFQFKASSNTNNKNFSFQQFVNWAIASGYCTGEQVASIKSQKDFINFFGPFFANQFGWKVSSGWTPAQVKSFASSNSNSTTKSNKKSSKKTRTNASKRKSTAKRHAPKRAGVGSKISKNAPKSTRKSATTPKSSTKRRSISKRRVTTTTARSYQFPKTGNARLRRAA